jgi:hypothetical protein
MKAQKRTPSRAALLVFCIVLIAATVALAATAINWSSVSEAQLVFAGGAPQPPLLEVKIEDGKHFFYVTSRPILKNMGSRHGAVQRVHVVAVGLKESPRELRVLHLDRSEIAPRETKEVRCEFVAVLDAAALDPTSRVEFRVHFYGPDNQEFYWEGITLENIASPSSLPRLRSREFVSVYGRPDTLPKPYSRIESL